MKPIFVSPFFPTNHPIPNPGFLRFTPNFYASILYLVRTPVSSSFIQLWSMGCLDRCIAGFVAQADLATRF
jgi:hypothetical protein